MKSRLYFLCFGIYELFKKYRQYFSKGRESKLKQYISISEKMLALVLFYFNFIPHNQVGTSNSIDRKIFRLGSNFVKSIGYLKKDIRISINFFSFLILFHPKLQEMVDSVL